MTGLLAAGLAIALVAAVLAAQRARRAAAEVVRLGAELERTRGAAEEVAAAHARLAGALAALPQGILLVDGRGDPVLRNEALEELGGQREPLLEEALASIADRALASRRGGPVGSRSLELGGPPRRVLELHGVPLAGPGDGAGALVVVEDITDRRRLEAVRRDFVSNISHELKTPVGALALLAETLLSEDDPAVARRLVERVLAEADRVGRTIDDLLALSEIETGAVGLHEEVTVQRCIEEAVARVRPAAEQRGVAVEVSDPGPRLAVVGDRRQLVSALFNLLDNAVKYSDEGSTVDVRTRTDGRWVDIAVSDHGIGIPRRDLERVFERFYRVDRARSRETGGTGLGLAIVRHVASNHRGEVRLDSEEGQGSTFTLRLPVGPGPVAVTSEAG